MIFTESEVVELKSKIIGDICKEVIAFANTKGGTLYICFHFIIVALLNVIIASKEIFITPFNLILFLFTIPN